MNKLKLGTAIATSAILLGAMAPAAFAATDVVVGNNGAFSKSKVQVKNVKVTTVAQTNKQNVKNVVNSKANTGGNKVSFNTGGTSSVSTSDSHSVANITVGGNTNTATVNSDCNCEAGATVGVTDNGAFSHNSVKVTNSNWFTALQTNVSNVFNSVNSSSNTGGNSSSFNTGGTSTVHSGTAITGTDITVNGSSNTLNQ